MSVSEQRKGVKSFIEKFKVAVDAKTNWGKNELGGLLVIVERDWLDSLLDSVNGESEK